MISIPALLLFTDGACGDWNKQRVMFNGRFGGYGVYRTTQRSYGLMTCTKHAGGQLRNDHYNQDIYSHSIHNHVSSRCSIDFCEAHAIRAGLRDLLLDLRELADTGHNGATPLITANSSENHVLCTDNTNKLLIISDSLVVLE